MLTVTVQKFGDVAILRCQGRIVVGVGNTILRDAVLSRTDCSTLVLDLEQVDRIDAGGLGVSLDLRARTRAKGIQLQLMNVSNRVQRVLELTHLDRVFEICAVESMFPRLPGPPQAACVDRSV
ncbi:MAG: STAS domain-containing protein [Acidobacteria bacterium]|nr:STAS domain-containing protein [Acidobacteriota bacterium]